MVHLFQVAVRIKRAITWHISYLLRNLDLDLRLSETQRAHNVETTSIQRWSNVLTLSQPCVPDGESQLKFNISRVPFRSNCRDWHSVCVRVCVHVCLCLSDHFLSFKALKQWRNQNGIIFTHTQDFFFFKTFPSITSKIGATLRGKKCSFF